MKTVDWIAVLIVCLAVTGSALTSSLVFEEIAHLEDEFAYLWQAEIYSQGDLVIDSPEFSSSFLIPFVVDFQGQRFSKYPPGWPAVLSLGFQLGTKNWVNPLLAGLGVWLTYRLGKHLFDPRVGLLAALLTGLSPLYLIQSGTFLSHTWSLVLTLIFSLSWIEIVITDQLKSGVISRLGTASAGISLGLLVLTRPLTSIAVALPFGIQGLVLLFKDDRSRRLRILSVGIMSLMIGALLLVWQKTLTGDYLTNPYTLWWSYDRLGFGPGIGVAPGGHNLQQAWWNTKHSLRSAASDLFGWLRFSWIFLPAGLWAGRKQWKIYPLAGVLISVIGLYMLYWVGSWLLGARYYFEALPAAAVLTAVGIFWLAEGSEKFQDGSDLKMAKFRRLSVIGLTVVLIFGNIFYYLPIRLGSLRSLYTIERSDQDPILELEAQGLTPALVIVHSDDWMSYSSLAQTASPYLDSELIFAWNIGPKTDQALAESYQEERNVFYYYPNLDPWELSTLPR
jgi:hypothetical protein